MLYLWVSVCVCAEDIQASFIQKFDPTYIHSCWAVIVFVLNLCGFEVFDCTLHKRTVFLSLRKWTCLHVRARCLADIVSAELQGCLPYSFLKLFFFWPQTQLSFSARSKVIHRETDHHDPCVLENTPCFTMRIYTQNRAAASRVCCRKCSISSSGEVCDIWPQGFSETVCLWMNLNVLAYMFTCVDTKGSHHLIKRDYAVNTSNNPEC